MFFTSGTEVWHQLFQHISGRFFHSVDVYVCDGKVVRCLVGLWIMVTKIDLYCVQDDGCTLMLTWGTPLACSCNITDQCTSKRDVSTPA